MSKIVIPKHSADLDEMSAVLKIHYEAKDWVKGIDFRQKLMGLIGDGQYPSSYPKKAQVPAYFGFLESKVSRGGRITERKISESGIEMYEAILSDDRSTRQRLLLEAIEKIFFGRNNSGCVSSNSDIEAPAILVKCILDTGYCTCSEYAYLVWSLNDKCKKYYESLDDVIKARSSGGIVVNAEASDYKDWKPILAMLRWGFLVKSDDDNQKVLLHQEVIEKYSSRLQEVMIYNIDKHDEIEEMNFDDISIDRNSEASYKPFKIDDKNVSKIPEGHFLQACEDIEKQKIYIGDHVLLVDRQISILAAYYSYLIKELRKKGENYEVGIQRQFAINKSKEKEMITALRAEDELSDSVRIQDAMKALINYDDYEMNLKIAGHSNKDILPAYLVLKALLSLDHLTNNEQDYLIYSVINSKETYSDVISTISSARAKNKTIYSEEMEEYSQLTSIQRFKDIGILDVYFREGRQGVQINPLIKDRYSEMISRLSFYVVDIARKNSTEASGDSGILPKVIKALIITKTEAVGLGSAHIEVSQNQVLGKLLVQGDFIVFVDEKIVKLQEMYVFQVIDCKKKKDSYQITFERRHVINPVKENTIIQMIKEA